MRTEHAKRPRRLLHRQTAKKSKLYDAGLAGILRRQLLERAIDGDQIRVAFAGREFDALQRHTNGVRPSAAIRATPSCDVDQNPAHHLCGYTKKVVAVLPARLIPPKQPETHFVDQRGRLERYVRSLARQVPQRHAMQFVVDKGYQPVERLRVSVAPDSEQGCDIAGGGLLVRLHAEGLLRP